MTKNEQTATMYESIPAVAELNKVPGFNPLRLLRRIVSPENGEVVLQLDLPYKKLWFRLANPKGRIRLNALRITEQMAIYEAQIYLERTDENPIGSFTSSCTKEEAPGGQYIQAAQQAAMDEALSDAGFGIQFADVNMGAKGSRYGSRIPANGAATDKNGSIPAGASTVFAERVQPSAETAGGTVKAFPSAAGKAETSTQEKPAQQSALPVREKMTAAGAGQGEKKRMDNSVAVHTVPQAKALSESAAGNNHATTGLPAGMQEGTESLPVNPENPMGNLPVQPGTEQVSVPVQITAEQPSAASAGTTKAGQTAETVQAERVQPQTESSSLPAGPQEVIQGTAQPASGELPVKEDTAESLPIQTNAGTPAMGTPENILPVSEKKDTGEDTQTAVQGMMALLGGQNISAVTDTKEPVQEKVNAGYTSDMPVEEIIKRMTFEEAGQVVVDAGVCKGQTLAEVAERRPPSLRFYVYGAYRGDNNILRAAARIMLDSLEAKKAG